MFIGFNQALDLPKALIVSCDEQVEGMICEANALNVPVIGFADAQSDVKGVDYVVPVCSFSRTANMFIYKMFAFTCSVAAMACERRRTAAAVATNSDLSKECGPQLRLFSACLHFKSSILDALHSRINHDPKINLLMSGAYRNLNLKLVLRWLLSSNLSAFVSLKSVINYVTFVRLRASESELLGHYPLLDKLLSGLQIIHSLCNVVKQNPLVNCTT